MNRMDAFIAAALIAGTVSFALSLDAARIHGQGASAQGTIRASAVGKTGQCTSPAEGKASRITRPGEPGTLYAQKSSGDRKSARISTACE